MQLIYCRSNEISTPIDPGQRIGEKMIKPLNPTFANLAESLASKQP
jgi:hypothetical protein